MANTNKRKGSDAERLYAKLFKEELGFSHCVTARYGSRIHDDAAIDLINLPFNVQIKAGKQRGMNPSKVLADMQERIAVMFPKTAPEHDRVSFVIHKKEVGKGRKRNEMDEMVHITWEDFKRLLKMINWEE